MSNHRGPVVNHQLAALVTLCVLPFSSPVAAQGAMPLATFAQMAAQCAPGVALESLASIARAESAFAVLALNVNRLVGQQPRATTPQEAARLAEGYVAQGYSVDLGLMQVNSANLPRLGLTFAEVLDPCTNIGAGARILREGYAAAVQAEPGQPQRALRVAFSRYNTGHPERGFANGYVRRVEAVAEVVVPAIQLAGTPSARPAPPTSGAPTPTDREHQEVWGARDGEVQSALN